MAIIYCVACHKKTKIKYGEIPVCRSCVARQAEFDKGEAVDTNALLEELEERIPGLFCGPTCPTTEIYVNRKSSKGSSYRTWGLRCDCTYKTGCRRLKNKDNKSLDKDN